MREEIISLGRARWVIAIGGSQAMNMESRDIDSKVPALQYKYLWHCLLTVSACQCRERLKINWNLQQSLNRIE